jgi:tetratricopeptide (TPR) repeat protein
MIVKNEEATLAHCLESVRPVVDEMIVLDTGSTDRTVEIAQDFGAIIYHFDWCDDFSAARNESLRHCTGDWVLILDADEAIDPLDYEKVRNACLNPFADAYDLRQRNYMHTANSTSLDSAVLLNETDYSEGKNFMFYADNPCLRLAKNFEGLSFFGKIHESLGHWLLSHGKTMAEHSIVLHHYGKLFSDREEHKAQYYFLLAKQDAEKRPTDTWAQFNLLQQALIAGKWEIALGAAQASLGTQAEVQPLIFYGAGLALQELGNHKEAIKYFDMLLRHAPDHAMTLLRKGFSLEALGNVDLGRQLMTRAIGASPSSILGYGYLAELELRAGNPDQARKVALRAIELAPGESAMYDLLIKIELSRNNHRQAAADATQGMRQCPGGGAGMWHRLVALHLIQSGEASQARSMLELGLQAFPNDSELMRLGMMIGQ